MAPWNRSGTHWASSSDAPRPTFGRFKAFIEDRDAATGAWRGVVHDGSTTLAGAETHERQGSK